MCNWISSFFFLVISSVSCFASGYPSDFFNQVVSLKSEGPAFFVHVANGFFRRELLGYKNSGSLAQGNPDFIEAVITSECLGPHGKVETFLSIVQLGREWHGAGYLSMPLEAQYHVHPECNPLHGWVFHIAYSDGHGRWDSKQGQNYDSSFTSIVDSDATFYRTDQPGKYSHTEINNKAWEFIIQELRK